MTEEVHDEKLLIGHSYDGIQELDNSLPMWWLYGFYFCIAFAVVYMLYYHFTGVGPSMEQEYLREMNQAGYRVPPVASEVASSAQEKLLALMAVLASLFVYVARMAFKFDNESQS
ncbi:MAG: hypothetical protein GKR89_19920 [Candidatus Latescibacteria bacterium]|nr:hypothetical protein [Candidatus Latescibacterota bacterium]